jgi:hypothetical protein
MTINFQRLNNPKYSLSWLSKNFAICLIFIACTKDIQQPLQDSVTPKEYPHAFAHGKIIEVFPNIFFVTGSNIVHYGGSDIQKSNNMVIIRNGRDLTLINTIRLNENGLKSLENLGKIKNVIRIGAFHDLNDPFYLDRYQAKLWAVKGMTHKNGRKADFEFSATGPIPLPDASIFLFETTSQPEAIIHIAREGGILVTCDSIKNWTRVDSYFSKKTGQEFLEQGLIAPAHIDAVWQNAMKPSSSDFIKLKQLKFRHLLSAHGEPLMDQATEQLIPTLERLSQ